MDCFGLEILEHGFEILFPGGILGDHLINRITEDGLEGFVRFRVTQSMDGEKIRFEENSTFLRRSPKEEWQYRDGLVRPLS